MTKIFKSTKRRNKARTYITKDKTGNRIFTAPEEGLLYWHCNNCDCSNSIDLSAGQTIKMNCPTCNCSSVWALCIEDFVTDKELKHSKELTDKYIESMVDMGKTKKTLLQKIIAKLRER